MNKSESGQRKGGIPRGIAASGPPILSYGFRPFFLGAGAFGLLSMTIWIGAVTLGWDIGGVSYGAVNWHAHELLFGYATAALAGFMLTAIPNWTGRLPVSGSPLLMLVLLWLLGRVVMLNPDRVGLYPAAVVDALFLPALAVIAAREIVAGRNWKNLKILIALALLAGINVAFHVLALTGQNPSVVFRMGVAVFVVLIAVVGGRIVPSFTRNWLSKARAVRLPHPIDRLDEIAIAALVVALASWAILPDSALTAALAAAASLLQSWRLLRWRGYATLTEPLLLILHVAYAFIPVGMAAVALAAMGWLSSISALHLLTVGAIGNTTFAVMTRATLGHTGRKLTASIGTSLGYLAIATAAVVRPIAEIMPDQYHLVLAVSAGAWIFAFAVFSIEYGRMLLSPTASLKRGKPTPTDAERVAR